jgi:hypothetical protein
VYVSVGKCVAYASQIATNTKHLNVFQCLTAQVGGSPGPRRTAVVKVPDANYTFC